MPIQFNRQSQPQTQIEISQAAGESRLNRAGSATATQSRFHRLQALFCMSAPQITSHLDGAQSQEKPLSTQQILKNYL